MSQSDHLSRKTVRKNTLWNLSGQVLPMLVVVVVIPILLKKLGAERFGLLTIVWMVTGYFSLFDLGLGRALTQYVAREWQSQSPHREMNQILKSCVLVLVFFGILVALILGASANVLMENFYRVGPELQIEGVSAVYWVALSLPFVISSTGLRGILEGAHRFDLVNLVRVPMSVVSYVSPALVSVWSANLGHVVLSILIFRVINFFIYLEMVQKIFGKFDWKTSHRWTDVYGLLRVGGWLTVTNVLNPLLVQVDRLIIGGILPVATLAYYTTPAEMMTKFWILPIAVGGVLFPTFAATFRSDLPKTYALFEKSYLLNFAGLFAGGVILSLFANDFLRIWLNDEFSRESTLILQILGWGVFLQGLASVPSTFLQSVGRPDWTAKLLLAELVFLAASTYFVTQRYGLIGTALVWSLRMTLDWLGMLLLAFRYLPELHLKKYLVGILLAAAFYLGVSVLSVHSSLIEKLIYLFSGIVISLIFLVLTGDHMKIRENFREFLR